MLVKKKSQDVVTILLLEAQEPCRSSRVRIVHMRYGSQVSPHCNVFFFNNNKSKTYKEVLRDINFEN